MLFSSKYKKLLFTTSAILLVIFLVACGTETKTEDGKVSENAEVQTSEEESDIDFSNEDNPIVTITMDNGNEIKAELYPDTAPNTVNNFISLIEAGVYDNLIFHRVIPEFMIQGGDPSGNGTGGPGYSIKGEFSANDFENPLKHDRGVLSMARSSSFDSAGSQFFIIVKDSSHLDTEYAAFGKVIEGMDEVDAIVNTERNKSDKPNEDQRMLQVTVDTKGVDYPEPEKE